METINFEGILEEMRTSDNTLQLGGHTTTGNNRVYNTMAIQPHSWDINLHILRQDIRQGGFIRRRHFNLRWDILLQILHTSILFSNNTIHTLLNHIPNRNLYHLIK